MYLKIKNQSETVIRNQMTFTITQENFEKFKAAFALFDKDGDDIISIEEFGPLMKIVGQNLAEAEHQEMIKKTDPDNRGKLYLPEFMTLMVLQLRENQARELIEQFRVYDEDNSGLISVDDFRSVMVERYETYDDEEIDELTKETGGKSDDGRLKYEKVARVLTSK